MEYSSVRQTAEKWGVSVRQVQALLKDNRVNGAVRFDNHIWMIPSDAKKPQDPRSQRKTQETILVSELQTLIQATASPWPSHDPDSVLDRLWEERLRLQYEAEFAYLRGEHKKVKDSYLKTEGDEAARISLSSLAIATAISTGDYALYSEIETFLKKYVSIDRSDVVSSIAELCLSNAYVSANVLNLVPKWLIDGDFSALIPQTIPDALYKRAKYFQYSEQYESMLAVAQTALEIYGSSTELSFHSIYFRVLCIMAFCLLNRPDEAKYHLLEVLKITLPHGFITPFAESITAFNGLLEACLEQEYPEYYDIVIEQWENTFVNWCIFHNRFTKDNLTLILSLRDYQIAQLVAGGVPYKVIAEQFHISLGTLKNRVNTIYEKLLISGKERKRELRKYIF